MGLSNCRRLLLLSLVCASLALAWFWVAPAPGQEKEKEKADRTEKVTLQYRVARDAFAPSRFLAVLDKELSAPLEIAWDLKAEGKENKEAQEQQKKEFDDLIKKLEAKQINGVEFECQAEWLKRGFKLRVTSVPQPTEIGKKRIKENER